MGVQQGRPQATLFNPAAEGYEKVQLETGAAIWLNRATGEELEEYQFISHNERDFQYEIDTFNFRLQSPYLVSTSYLGRSVQNEVCGSTYIGDLFVERIPMRLS